MEARGLGTRLRMALATWREATAYTLLASCVLWAHLAEIHLLDARAGAWARNAFDHDFTSIAHLESPFTHVIGVLHAPGVVAGTTLFYLAVFIGFLATVPWIVASTGDARLLRRTLLAYPVVYLLALPFFLFFPSVNPYTHHGLPSPFSFVHPNLEGYYYLFTSRDNTVPSLHVAFTAVLLLQVWRTPYRRLRVAYASAGLLLMVSVVFLRVHYVLDVAAGLLAAWLALRIVDAALSAQGGPASHVGTRLDAWSTRLAPVRATAVATPDDPSPASDLDDAVVRDARVAARAPHLEE